MLVNSTDRSNKNKVLSSIQSSKQSSKFSFGVSQKSIWDCIDIKLKKDTFLIIGWTIPLKIWSHGAVVNVPGAHVGDAGLNRTIIQNIDICIHQGIYLWMNFCSFNATICIVINANILNKPYSCTKK